MTKKMLRIILKTWGKRCSLINLFICNSPTAYSVIPKAFVHFPRSLCCGSCPWLLVWNWLWATLWERGHMVFPGLSPHSTSCRWYHWPTRWWAWPMPPLLESTWRKHRPGTKCTPDTHILLFYNPPLQTDWILNTNRSFALNPLMRDIIIEVLAVLRKPEPK